METNQSLNFREWATLMNEVYGINNNGKWAVLFALMCSYAKDIQKIDRRFSTLSLIGPTCSGKTSISNSLCSAFSHKVINTCDLSESVYRLEDYCKTGGVINLECVTNRNTPRRIFEIIQNSTLNENSVASFVITSNEDLLINDCFLYKYGVVLSTIQYFEYNEIEEGKYKTLRAYADCGLQNIFTEIQLYRKEFIDYYSTIKDSVCQDIHSCNLNIDSNIRTTMSQFLTVLRLTEEKTQLHLPFSYSDFFPIAINQVGRQQDFINN